MVFNSKNEDKLSRKIDQTLLKNNVSFDDYLKWAEENKDKDFKTLCVPPFVTRDVVTLLMGTSTECCTVIGFPAGYSSSRSKEAEARLAALSGASEIDIVLNIPYFLSGKYEWVKSDLKRCIDSFHDFSNVVGKTKVIIETCYLTEDQILKASELVVESKADFVKTSTGFGTRGASIRDIELIKSVVPTGFGIKASGGISGRSEMCAMLDAGATRVGTSNGLVIISGEC